MKNKFNAQTVLNVIKKAPRFIGHAFTGACALMVPAGAAYLAFADDLNPQQPFTIAPEVTVVHRGYSKTVHYQQDHEPTEVAEGNASGMGYVSADDVFKLARLDIKENPARDHYATIGAKVHIQGSRFAPGYKWREDEDENGNGIPNEVQYATLGNKWHANDFARDLKKEQANYLKLKAALERKDGTWDNFAHQTYYNTAELFLSIFGKDTFAEKVAKGVLLGPPPKKAGGPDVSP